MKFSHFILQPITRTPSMFSSSRTYKYMQLWTNTEHLVSGVQLSTDLKQDGKWWGIFIVAKKKV